MPKFVLSVRKWFSLLFPPPREFPTLAADGIPWEVHPVPERVVAVGDVHGDLRALGAILLEAELINEQGDWRGGKTHLVFLGDLVGGHPHSRLLLSFVLRLEEEARAEGGAVHALLGNHDLLPAQGNLRKMDGAERKLYRKFPVEGAASRRPRDAFRGSSRVAKWVRSRNALLKIGETLFVHAGVDEWALENDPGRINSTVRAWIRFWQGVGSKPPKATRWTAGVRGMERGSRHEIGPLWNRSFKPKNEDGPSPKILRAVLEKYGVRRMVVGHSPVKRGEVQLSHPVYGEAVVLVDTRISDRERGSLSALEIHQTRLQAITASRRKDGESLVSREKRAVKAPRPSSLIHRIFGALLAWWRRYF